MKINDVINNYNNLIKEFNKSEKLIRDEKDLQDKFSDNLKIIENEEILNDKPGKELLTEEEKLTLYFLFGYSKPEEFNFYSNKVNIDQIVKGKLLDVKG